MKKTLLLLMFTAFGVQAQTTHDLDWEIGIGSNLNLTINVGDKVRWTWTDTFPHTVQSEVGSTETFNSGTKTGLGSSYIHTFNVIGTNPYKCGFHPLSMAGTITVENPLDIEEYSIENFTISPNPAYDQLSLIMPNGIEFKSISIFDLLGQKMYSSNKLEYTIDISKLNKGLYLIKVSSLGISHTKRFIKL
jgi:hypothetical protein